MNSEELQNELNRFHGTETYHRHRLNPHLVWTDGVDYFARQAQASWFITILAVGTGGRPGPVPRIVPRCDEFAIVLMEVRGHTATLRLYSDSDEDGNYPQQYLLYEEEIEYTDCLPGTWKFYLEQAGDFVKRTGDYAVLMLPNER